jgi:hypothetical protein
MRGLPILGVAMEAEDLVNEVSIGRGSPALPVRGQSILIGGRDVEHNA